MNNGIKFVNDPNLTGTVQKPVVTETVQQICDTLVNKGLIHGGGVCNHYLIGFNGVGVSIWIALMLFNLIFFFGLLVGRKLK